ncbi:MAG: phytanoyl-CoA dioxygenase family protein [Planctomycetota bacterium]|nr:phytanoyl-CoA dioxygenase family protein [Planctomycetota bacterium]MDA1140293.1 phytanoyl-CoA dioxygenase family protein [Planctomycetota bacterium]
MQTFKTLSPHALEHYEEQGYVVLQGLIPQELISGLLDRVDGILEGRYEALGLHHVGAGSDNSPDDPGRLNRQIVVVEFPAQDPVINEIMSFKALELAARQLMHRDVAEIFQFQAMVKEPGCDNPTPWHQDDGYWKYDHRDQKAITAWMPLLATTAENGTMWLLPESHKGPIHEHVQAGGVSNYRTVAESIDESKLVPLELSPGDVSFHHQKTIHGAFSNSGTKRRVIVASHYHS